jgi:predicted nucleic acid-binding protein
MIFVDTSAVHGVINPRGEEHPAAARTWKDLRLAGEELLTTSYVVVELMALAQRRLGLEAVRVLDRDILPLIEIVWIDADLHHAALAAVFAAGHRNLSLVDCASFEVMRRRGLRTAFTRDRDFAEQGFDTIP